MDRNNFSIFHDITSIDADKEINDIQTKKEHLLSVYNLLGIEIEYLTKFSNND